MAPKITLLYTGPKKSTQYSSYSNTQLNSLVGGGSTDFLILTAYPMNLVKKSGEPILNYGKIDGLPSTCFAKDMAYIKNRIKQEIDEYWQMEPLLNWGITINALSCRKILIHLSLKTLKAIL